MTGPVDPWDIHPKHSWLRGAFPTQPVEYDEQVGRIVLNRLRDRFAELRTDAAAPPTFLTPPDFTGVWTLPLRARR